MQHPLTIPAQYNGPTGFGNGGYVCGRMANSLPWTAEFRLRQMIPVARELQLEVQEQAATLFSGQETYVTARPGKLAELEIPSPPSFAAAEKAAKNYLGHRHDLEYSHCYVCSTSRPDDGMCVHTGSIENSPYYAAPWVPRPYMAADSGTVRPEFLYAALDCPGAYASMGQEVEILLLGQFTVRLTGSLRATDNCVVMAWCSDKDERRRYAHTVLYGPSGQLVGRADAVWWRVNQ